MDAHILLRGMVLGFWIAAPVGPIGVLCIRRTLADGKLAGFMTGLGAATADGVYGFIAGFGLTVLASGLLEYEILIRVLGGLYLCYLGLRTLAATPGEPAEATTGTGLFRAYGSTLILTLTNPSTIIAFSAIFASLGTLNLAGFRATMLLVLGVFGGSACWWLLLCGGVGLLRSRLTAQRLGLVNRISGAGIVGFGIVTLLGVGGWLR